MNILVDEDGIPDTIEEEAEDEKSEGKGSSDNNFLAVSDPHSTQNRGSQSEGSKSNQSVSRNHSESSVTSNLLQIPDSSGLPTSANEAPSNVLSVVTSRIQSKSFRPADHANLSPYKETCSNCGSEVNGHDNEEHFCRMTNEESVSLSNSTSSHLKDALEHKMAQTSPKEVKVAGSDHSSVIV